jgi:hypothetical protein
LCDRRSGRATEQISSGPRSGSGAAAPASERPRLSADIARAFPQLGIEILPAEQMPSADDPDRFNLRGLQRRLGHDYRTATLQALLRRYFAISEWVSRSSSTTRMLGIAWAMPIFCR